MTTRIATLALTALLALTFTACDTDDEAGYCKGHPNNSSACDKEN